MSYDISNLSEKELDFFKFSFKNIEKFINLSIKEISKIYGCGISFIYRYFEKLKISGIKEYLLFLINERQDKKNILNEIATLTKNSINSYNSLIINFQEEINEYKKIIDQSEKMKKIKAILYNSKKIYGLAFGHSKLAIQDFFGFYNYINSNIELINYDDNKNLKNYLEPNCVILFYSIRFINKKFKKILADICQIKTIKTILITSNVNKNLLPYFDEIFYINNVMKHHENLKLNYYLGPLNCFLMFNNYLKAEIFNDKKEFLLKNKAFLKETLGWTDYTIARDI